MTNKTEMPDEIWAKRYGESNGGTYWNKDTGSGGVKYIRAGITLTKEDAANVRDALLTMDTALYSFFHSDYGLKLTGMESKHLEQIKAALVGNGIAIEILNKALQPKKGNTK